jgi:replication fork protection complex subunit Csm3/Swi3
MLNMYQFWLDELYPRAKFADGLAMIEKLGHSKHVQMMRKEWIDEGKPRHNAREDDDEVEVIGADESAQRRDDPMEGVQESVRHEAEVQQDNANAARDPSAPPEEPDEDELDALLADDPPSVRAPATTVANPTPNVEDDPFADAMEAMADMDDMW